MSEPVTGHEAAAERARPSADRIAEWQDGARKVLADDLPAGHKLWKSWALDLADQVLALAAALERQQQDTEALRRKLLALEWTEEVDVNGEYTTSRWRPGSEMKAEVARLCAALAGQQASKEQRQ